MKNKKKIKIEKLSTEKIAMKMSIININASLLAIKRKLEFIKPSFFVAWIAIFFMNYLRAAELFAYPSFWAEDGTYFFKDSIELGFSSIYTPIVGHFHTIPRILSYLGTFLPIETIPLYYIITAGLVFSGCCAYFVRDGFSWIVESKWLRFIIAGFISILPGSEEIALSYCTMNYILFIWITLFFLEDYRGSKRQNLIRELLFATIWFSAGQGIVFLPILIYQVWRKNYLCLISLTTLLASVILNSVTTHFLKNNSYNVSNFDFDRIYELIVVYFDNVFMRFVYIPILNHRGAHDWALGENFLFYVLATILLGFFIFRIYKSNQIEKSDLKIKFLLLLFFTPIVFVLIYLVRSYVSQTMFKEGVYFVGRYAMQPFFVVFLLYLLLIKTFLRSHMFFRVGFYLFVGFVFYNIFGYDLEFTSPRIGDFERVWPLRAKEIEDAITKVRIRKESSEEHIGAIRCRPTWWDDQIKEIVIK